jgi:hypothetical protein
MRWFIAAVLLLGCDMDPSMCRDRVIKGTWLEVQADCPAGSRAELAGEHIICRCQQDGGR